MASDPHGLLGLWMDVPPALEDDFNAWYDREHLAERIGVPGFRSARRYVALAGAPRYVALYRLDEPAVVASEAYRRFQAGAITPASRRIQPQLKFHRAVCARVAEAGRGAGGVLATLRFAPSPGSAALLAGALPGLSARPGIIGASVWATDMGISTLDAALGGAPRAADTILLIEGTQEAAAGAALEAALAALPPSPPILQRGLYRLMAALSV